MGFYSELLRKKEQESYQQNVGFSVESDYIKEQREKALAYLGNKHVIAKDSTFTKSWRDF